jgi:amino acid transporter
MTATDALSYILPLSAIAAAGIPVDQFTTGSWTDAARLLAGPWLAVAVVIGGIINGVGMFNALTLSYTRLPVVMAEDRMMPSALARRNRRRSPWVAILLCGLGWALALGFTYERLISIDLILYGASLVLKCSSLQRSSRCASSNRRWFGPFVFPAAWLACGWLASVR